MDFDHKKLFSLASRPVRIVLSVLISLAILGALYLLLSNEQIAAEGPQLFEVIANVVWPVAALYVFTQIMQTGLRSMRYRVLLQANRELPVPSQRDMFLITLCRNMFVDMLPARAGELSYVVLLNRGYGIPAAFGLSSLAISLVFDILALAVLLAFIVLVSIAAAQLAQSSAGGYLLVSLGLLSLAMIAFRYALPCSERIAALLRRSGAKWLQQFAEFLVKVGDSVEQTRNQRTLAKVVSLSLGIRLFKYAGLYVLFVAVCRINYADLASVAWWQVIPAFVSAEAAASLPLPAFMSFGPYEAGGTAALSILGFPAAQVLIVMLVIHLLSQIVDYTLGGMGLLGLVFIGKSVDYKAFEKSRHD